MTADQLLARVRSAAARSDLLRAVASVRSDGGLRLALGGVDVRPLSEGEVTWLEGQGNTAEDWSRVRVAEGFHPGRVRNCEFRGDVVLGRFVGMVPVRPGTELPSGIYNATVADSVIGHGALVRDVRLLAGYVVGPGAVVWDCGRVSAEPDTTFGNGAALPVGVETGGREVHAFAELDVELAAAVVRPGRRVGLRPRYAAAVAAYAERARSPRGIIERGARVVGAQQVRNAYVGPSALVDGPTLLADSTLLSSPEEPARVEAGTIVQGALLQWGSRVSTAALVEKSVLTEHSVVERQGKVTASILGP